MKIKPFLSCALLLSIVTTTVAHAEDFRAAMEAFNVRWLQAYNDNHPEAFLGMYVKDAVLLPQKSKPIEGREAIAKHWGEDTKTGGLKDHTFEIIRVEQNDKLAYQVNRWTLLYINEKGERRNLSGNGVAIFEGQPDGSWLIKVHIYNVD